MRQFLSLVAMCFSITLFAQDSSMAFNYLDKPFDEIIFIEREQYRPDHHNTETIFQKGEICENNFTWGSALKAFNVKTKSVRTIIESPYGIVRDPEVSFDGKRILFSMRKNKDDYYHIYEIDLDGKNLRQLTFMEGTSDIDPIYLPDGTIIFSGSREPKYCMCNRNMMCNMYRMEADGANITQIGFSTLFEGQSSLTNDGRVIYNRWEYVDRNFGDAQGLWTVNPDGTKHSIYYGNNTCSPGAVMDPRAVPGSDLMACIFAACHDRPWGALAVIDRKLGVDSIAPLVHIFPKEARWEHVGVGHFDQFRGMKARYEDPFPIDKTQILVSRWIRVDSAALKEKAERLKNYGNVFDSDWYSPEYKMGIWMVNLESGEEDLIYEAEKGAFDPQPLAPRFKPAVIPDTRNYAPANSRYYVQNVYEGTNMKGVVKGSVKYLRVVESPPKLTWTKGSWVGNGEQAPGMNYKSLENKVLLGDVPVEDDGSAYFEIESGKFIYFQLLDKDKKMIQSMRSGTMAHQGEVSGCIGCHEDRINVPPASSFQLKAMSRKPSKLGNYIGDKPEPFSYVKNVQPIFNKHCVQCHDFDQDDRTKLVLAGDRNSYFNASYIELWNRGIVNEVGGGPSPIQEPYTWGAHASKLTAIIDSDHHKVKLSLDEKRMLYTWMDMNGVYYPTYDAAYPDNLGGRSPLDNKEMARLGELTGVNFVEIGIYRRTVGPQISFDRPELSPALDKIRGDKAKYDEAVALLTLGGERLKEKSNGEVLEGFIPCDEHKRLLKIYEDKKNIENEFLKARVEGRKKYDEGSPLNAVSTK